MYGVSATTHATSWPCMRTLSVASTACVSPERVGIQARLCSARSAGDDGDDALERLRARGVDREDARVREGAAQDRHVQHPGRTMSST